MSCRSISVLASLLLALSSCDKSAQAPAPAAPGAARPAGPYFDVRGLLDGQIRQLTASQHGATKQVKLRSDSIETVFIPKVQWADELQLFYQADINKSALRGAYTVDSVRSANGIVRYTYRLKPGHNTAPVQLLRVMKDGVQLEEIAVTLRQDNPLFFGQKVLDMRLEQGELTSYGVRGVQKLILFDTLRYQTLTQVE